jgi:cytosine/adenosine deaminase-related metal-dependent hydrolase
VLDLLITNVAKVMHLQGHGLEPDCDASFVLLPQRLPATNFMVSR